MHCDALIADNNQMPPSISALLTQGAVSSEASSCCDASDSCHAPYRHGVRPRWVSFRVNIFWTQLEKTILNDLFCVGQVYPNVKILPLSKQDLVLQTHRRIVACLLIYKIFCWDFSSSDGTPTDRPPTVWCILPTNWKTLS